MRKSLRLFTHPMSRPIALLVIVWVGFALWTGLAWLFTSKDPNGSYRVVQVAKSYEVRKYEPSLMAQIQVPGPSWLAYSEGAKILRAYFSGDNAVQSSVSLGRSEQVSLENATIARALPIFQETKNGNWLVSVLVPSKYSSSTLPRPNDPRVRIIQAPESLVAALAFSGNIDQAVVDKETDRLKDLIISDRRIIVGSPKIVQYSPAWAPMFLQRNEVLIPIR